MAGNYFDQFDEAPKTSSNFFDQFDEEDTAAPAKKKKSVSGSAGVPVPSPSFIGAPVKEAPKITGPDRWLNVIPQGVGEAAAGIAGLGGVAVDTLLNVPRSMAAATLPKSAYESVYGTPPEVPFTATTEFGADVAQSVRAGAEDVFPAPLANKRFNAEVAAGDGGFVDAVTAAYNNPFGAAQEMAKQAVTTATLAPALGLLPALGVMEGGAPEQAGASFDEEWKQGIPQQSAAYKELEAAVGPDEARRILRTQRMQRTSQLQAAAGMAAGKLSEAVGGMELEKVLAGQAAKAFGVKEVAKQAIAEMPEEMAVAAAGNIASQYTGNPGQDTTQGLGGAAGLGLVMGGGQAATIGGVQAAARNAPAAIAGVAAGAAKVRERLSQLGAKAPAPEPLAAKRPADATKPATDTVDTRTAVTGFQNQGLDPNALGTPKVPAFVTILLSNPEWKATYENLLDPAKRAEFLSGVSEQDTEKKAKIAIAMAANAADREWVSKHPITEHTAFADADAAVRGGATSLAKLREKVPALSRITAKAVIDHMEKVGVVSPPDKARKRTVLQPAATPVAPTLMPDNAIGNTEALKDNKEAAVQPSIESAVQTAIQPALQDNVVEQKNSVTLPEVGRIIAQEPAAVNTPAPTQTETVQAKTPKVGNYQPVAGGYESRVTAHTLGSNALDPTADAGALIYEYRKEGQAGPPMTMVVGKSGKLIPASQAVTGNKSSGEAWIPPTKDAGDAVRALLLTRGNLDAAGRAENSAQIAAIVAPRVEPKGPIRLAPMPPKIAEAPVVETPTSPAAPIPASPAVALGAVGATTLPAPSQNAPVAPPAQPQAPSAVVPPVTGLTPETKKRRQAAKSQAAVATPATDTGTIGTSKQEPKKLRVFDRAEVMLNSGDSDYLPFMRDIHEGYMKARGKSAEGTYVRQVLDGVEPTAAPTEDDAAFLKTMGLTPPSAPAPVATPVISTAPAPEAPAASAAPAKPKPKSKLVIKQEKDAADREAARVASEANAKADAERTAAKIPSDADFAMAGMSPGEIALAKKTKPQDVFDAINRGEIRVAPNEASTPTGMRPVTDADIAKAKTRPEKEKLARLKAKYEQATDAPRKLSPASITNVRKEAIVRAYERIKAIAQAPNMSQFDAIPSDPESTKAILGLQAEAQKTATTEAELAKKLEDTYVANYVRSNPSADLAPKGWDGTDLSTEESDAAAVADSVLRSKVSNGKQALEAVISGEIPASPAVREMARRLLEVSDMTDVPVVLHDDATAADLIRKEDGSKVAGRYSTGSNTVDLLTSKGGRTEDIAEVIVHELAHAGTIRAMIQLESGALVDPELSALLEDMKAGLLELRRRFDAGEVRDPEGRVEYAARNLYELVATVYGSPRAARRLDDVRVTIPRRGARRGRVTTVLQTIKDFVARLFGSTPQQVDRVLLSTRIREAVERMSATTSARTDFAATPAAYDADAALRANSRGGKKGSKSVDNAPPAAQKPLTETDDVGLGSIRRLDSIIGLLRNRGVASQDAQKMIEARHGLQEAMRVEAESAIEQVKQALVDATSGASKATAAVYRQNLLKYLHGDKTAALPAAVVTKIEELRQLMDSRSIAMVAMGLVPKNKIKTVLENIGKWTHRDYKVFNLRPGRNNKQGEYKKLQQVRAKRGHADLVKDVIEDIKNEMRVPDKATLRELMKAAKDPKHKDHESAKATIDAWKLRWRLDSTLKPKEVRAALIKISQLNEAELQKQAAEYANFMLDPLYENAPAEWKADFNRLAGLYADDTSITEDRTPLPKWLKTLWGEYTDWETISVLSLDNQAQIITKFVTLANYKAALLAKGKAFKSDDLRSKKGFTLLHGKSFGPLNGYYIPQEDLWLIQSANTAHAIDVALGAREHGGNSPQAIVRRWAASIVGATAPVGQLFKFAAVLANHTTVMINGLTSALMLSGAIPRVKGALKAVPNGFKIARASSFADVGVRGAGMMLGRALENGTELQRQLLFLVSKNVLHDAALSADMKRKMSEQLTAEVDAMLSPADMMLKYYVNPLHLYGYAKDRLSRFNSFGDEFGKYIMWASRVDALREIDPSMPQKDLETLAAEQTVATMPSFMAAMPLARMVSNSGIVDPFLTFNTEQLRNIYNSAAIAVKYGFGNGGRAAKMYAASEAVSLMTRLGAVAGFNAVAALPALWALQFVTDLFDDDEDEKVKEEEKQIAAAVPWNHGEKYAAIRASLPEYVHGGVQILRDMGDGKFTFTSGQRFDPGMAGSLLEAAMYGTDESFQAILLDYFMQITPTLPGLLNTASGWADYYAAKEGSDARVAAADETAAGLRKLADTYKPGSWKTLARADRAEEQGIELSAREKILNNVGFTVQIFDANKAASRIAADYNGVQRSTSRGIKDAMDNKEPELDFHTATLQKLGVWELAHEKVANLKAMGLDYPEIYRAVKDDPVSKGISERELQGLYEGSFPLTDYVEVVGNSRKDALVKAGTNVEETEALYLSYLKQAQEAEQQMRAILESQGVRVQ